MKYLTSFFVLMLVTLTSVASKYSEVVPIGSMATQPTFLCNTKEQIDRILQVRMLQGYEKGRAEIDKINKEEDKTACGSVTVMGELIDGFDSYIVATQSGAPLTVQVTKLRIHAMQINPVQIIRMPPDRFQYSWSNYQVVTKEEYKRLQKVSRFVGV